MKLVENEIVWTCAPPIECGFDDRLHLHEPRQVKLKVKCNVWQAHGFNETGEIDSDTNATIYARENNVFATRKEANDYYASYLTYEISALQRELEDFQKLRED